MSYYFPNNAAIQRQIDYLRKQITWIDRKIQSLLNQKTNAIQALQNLINSRSAQYDQVINQQQTLKNNLLAKIAELEALINNPNPPTPPATSFGQLVLNVHNSMMTHFNSPLVGTSEDGMYVIPFIPRNYNFRMSWDGPGSSNDYESCGFSSLGSDSGGLLNWIDVIGYFGIPNKAGRYELISSTTPSQAIVSGCRYIVRKVYLPADSLGQPMKVIDIPNNNLGVLKVSSTARSAISFVVNHLNKWASDAAFLCPPALCKNYYYSIYDDGIMPPGEIVYAGDYWNNVVAQVITPSTNDPSISLPNPKQAWYYDRLYQFMQVKGYTSANTVTNLLQNFTI